MQVQVTSSQKEIAGATQGAASWLPLCVERRLTLTGLRAERSSRQPIRGDADEDQPILASRWTDEGTTARVEHNIGLTDRYIIAVALRQVRLRLGYGSDRVFDGVMPSGMIHVTEPGQILEAEFFTPCDFIHFHVDAAIVRDRQTMATVLPHGRSGSERSLRDLLLRDDLVTQLARTLTEDLDGCDNTYAQSVGQTIVMRVLALRPAEHQVGPLQKWRLRRVHEHLEANLAESISLADLAEAAGLSRMHFAAQFRVATGCRPHDFLLQHRIECARAMLANSEASLVEVALNVGFQTQSHFSTVFKRLVGSTPASWRRTQRAGDDRGDIRTFAPLKKRGPVRG